MKKRAFFAAVLAAALTAGLCTGAGAAASSFDDITDPATAVNADVLRLMGVVTGAGNNQFMPDSGLSRAEFCVMVTNFIQRGDEVSRYSARTIFGDVTGRHWARGFINLMATPDEGGTAMISGIGNGNFAPEQKVTVAQAVTVLLRVLDYSSKETGVIWPQSYMDLAQSIGLTDGLPSDPNAVLTRAQTAQLFVNAMGCPTRGGQKYYKNLGSVSEDVILLAVGVTSDDASSDSAVRTSLDGEAFLPACGEVSPTALLGQRGSLVLNEREEIVAFLPDDSNSVTVTLSGKAQPSFLTASDSTRYTVSASTVLYSADNPRGVNYIEGYAKLRPGTRLTLFSRSGKITAIYAAGSSQTDAGSVVLEKGADSSVLSRLTGNSGSCTILKNGQSVSFDRLQPLDVLTYDRMNNTVLASEVRLKGYYEDAYPNAQAPLTIRSMGMEFDVLDSAWEDMDGVDIGDEICLLLTADGKVAGIREPDRSTNSNAVGLVGADGVEVFLSNGTTLRLPGDVDGGDRYSGQLVEVKSVSKRGVIDVSELSGKKTSAQLDLDAMTLGQYPVSAGVRVFDQVKSSGLAEVDLNTLTDVPVDGSDIKLWHLDSSGYVDYIVLDNLTGEAYLYGICTLDTVEGERFLTFENGVDDKLSSVPTPIMFRDGQISGIALGADGKVKSIVALEKLENLSPADFYEKNGITWLECAGRQYQVSEDVSCLKQANGLWISGESGSARLGACMAFSDNLTAYCDPIIGQIRVVAAQ